MKTNEENCAEDLQRSQPASTSSIRPNAARDAGIKCVIGLLILFIGWLAVKARTDYVMTQQALDGTIELLKDPLAKNVVARESSSLTASR